MQMSFAVIDNLKEFEKKCTLTKSREAKIRDNKITTRVRFNKELKICSILLGESSYFKNIYFKDVNNNYYDEFYQLINYNKISKNKLIEIDCKLVADTINKYIQKKEVFNLLIFRLKYKCYLNLITPNFYYIFRFKNNNFKLIKTFKLWNNFGLDEKNNLYYINSVMQFYKVHKTSHLYNKFFNLVNLKYKNANSIIPLIATKRNHQFQYCNIYEIMYRKKKVSFKLKEIDFSLRMWYNWIHLEANKIILSKSSIFLFII